MQATHWEASRASLLWEAAADFCFFQNRGYPRSSCLEWVGNRHALTSFEREILHRGVFGQKTALERRAKRWLGSDWYAEGLAVDGHNVQITVESALMGRPLLKGNDTALRDLAGQSFRYRMTEVSEAAMDRVFWFLEAHRPQKVLFFFDAPMSRSGALAARYAERILSAGLTGEARAVPVPEREIAALSCAAASSDGAVLDRATRWIDLAACCLEAFLPAPLVADFSPMILSRPPGVSPGDPSPRWP